MLVAIPKQRNKSSITIITALRLAFLPYTSKPTATPYNSHIHIHRKLCRPRAQLP